MLSYRVSPSLLAGEVSIPPSKSHTLRAVLLASLADGISHIEGYLHSPDTHAMITACRLLGAGITVTPACLTIAGVAGNPHTPAKIIDAGNSGQVLRFIAAIAALCEGYTVITGDDSICTNRPIAPLLAGLTGLGACAVSTRNNGYAPVIIKGPFVGHFTQLPGEDSQPVSGLLMAAAFAPHPTRIEVSNPGETPWIDLTLDWLTRLGVQVSHRDYKYYEVAGSAQVRGFDYRVPGDFSSCAFPLAGALVTQSSLVLNQLDWHDVQGDKALIRVLQAAGARIDIAVESRQLQVHASSFDLPQVLSVNQYIDALPILAVLACFSASATHLTGAGIARCKESDRIAAITQELRKMGAQIEEQADGLIIQPACLQGAVLSSHHDHRIAMALVVAALAASGDSVIQDVGCVDKSYPNFARDMQAIGAAVQVAECA